ncbi:TNT domain-containing protein [Haloechinothrix salitolerans]|uniref:Glycohydrolase toxin TNT-related protein n=1 Tax=Haloechinothrix salitolerans TaxID=926830 RepID=A0ABW2C9B1_9PSEU
MGIELPRELADIAARTGVRWPEADEDAMREQARAWRDAAAQLTTLASDADASATAAFDGMSGEGAAAARMSWARVVDADTGELDRAARGATEAADRLEHAADRIAESKVEMVRQLTEAARQVDAANVAADGGHPDALAGVSTLLGKTSADLNATANTLASEVADPVRGGSHAPDAPVPETDPERTSHGGAESVLDVPGEAVQHVGDTASGLTDAGPLGADAAADDVLGGADDVPGRTPDDVPGRTPDDVSLTAPTPPSGVPIAGDPYADAPTPPSGFPAGAGSPGVPPRGAYPSGQPMPPIDGSTGLAGFADAPAMPPPAPAAPSAGPGPVGGPPAGYNAPGAGMGAAPFGGAAPPAQGQNAPQPHTRNPASSQPPQQAVPQPTHQPTQRPAPPPEPQASTGTPRQDRGSVVALFLVHMFPIGHLPVPASAPAYQLPPRDDEADFATGLRFPPHDHPESHRIDPGEPPEPGADQAVRGLPAEHPAVADLCENDPLAAPDDDDWRRRFVVARDSTRVEYVWPPGELHPEGCREHGEPIVLPVGTVIDRFGDEHGRVFAADRSSYPARSLPPARLESGYHRYRVLRELPVWAAELAPWFGQPGGGLRYRAVYPVTDLLALGYLAEATPEPSETGEGT